MKEASSCFRLGSGSLTLFSWKNAEDSSVPLGEAVSMEELSGINPEGRGSLSVTWEIA